MSKKYAVRGVRGWKLAAAAALAVAGLVGVVWAAFPTTPTSASSSMGVTYEIKKTLEIECTGKNPDQDVLRTTDVLDANLAKSNPGTLGTIRVKTNSPGWDVQMTTDFGGRLVFKEGEVRGPDVCTPGDEDPWDPLNLSKCSTPLIPGPIITAGSYTPLTYNTSATADGTTDGDGVIANDPADEVQLMVSIGLAYRGDQLNASATGGMIYGIGAPNAYALPIQIAPDVLKAAVKTGTNYASGVTPAAVSFAKVLGNATDGYGKAANWSGTPKTGLRDGTTTRTWAQIVDNGFPTPYNAIATTPPDHVDEQYFFVNVGMNSTLLPNISGNEEHVYTEKFTFTLAANF